MPSNQSWVPPANAVVKLHVGDNEIRRVTASNFIKDDCLVYRLLVKKAVQFSGMGTGDDSSLKNVEVKTSYTDEDGDVISFSSKAEFVDAWKNCAEKVFRVKSKVIRKNVEVPKDTNEGDTPDDEIGAAPMRLGRRDGKGRGLVGIRGRLGKLETQVEQIVETMEINPDLNNVEASNNSNEGDALNNEMGTVPNRFGRRDCKGRFLMAIRGRVNKLEAQVEQIVQTMKTNPALENMIFKMEASEDYVVKEIDMKEAPKLEAQTPTKWNEVHINAQCDGCSMWPIKGTRYHATDIPDYDLCKQCYDSKTSDISFTPLKGVMCPDFAKAPFPIHVFDAGPPCQGFSRSVGVKVKVPDDKVMCGSPGEATDTGTDLNNEEKHYGFQCDNCTINPIVGFRYRATNMANYDLCAQCHADVKLPDVQFEKVARHSFEDNENVLGKESFGTSALCFDTFEENVLGKEFVKGTSALCFDTFDKDADPPCDSDLNADDDIALINHSDKQESGEKTDGIHCDAGNGTFDKDEETLGVSDGIQCNVEVPTRKLVLKNEGKLGMAPDARPEVHRRFSCDGCLMCPIVGPRYSAKSDYDFDLCEQCHLAKKIPDVEFERVMHNVTSSCPYVKRDELSDVIRNEPEFIHGRHTCDGCMMTPIIGFRYNALNLPDYDLCSQCYGKYDGDEIKFEVDELDRDHSRQAMWRIKVSKGNVKSFEQRRNKASRIVNEKKIEMKSTPTDAHEENIQDSADIFKVLDQTLDNSAKVVGSLVKEFTDALEKEITILDEGPSESGEQNCSPRSVINGKEKPNSPDKLPAKEEPKDSGSLPCDIRGEDSAKGISEMSSLPSFDFVGKDFDAEPIADNSKEEKEGEATDDIELMPEDERVDIICMAYEDDLEDVDVNKIIDDLGSEKVTISSSDNVSGSKDEKSHEDDDNAWDEGLSGDEKSEATADEWDILDDVAQQIESDAALARAASLVGSALFEDSQKGSTPSSYTLPRWSTELKRLHELGFFDDRRSIEVLDSLNAANIGSDVTDPIRIEKVVDRLLEKED